MENQLYLSSSPHIHSGETTDKVMRLVIYALLPATALSIYFFGLPALSVLLICTLGCVPGRYPFAEHDEKSTSLGCTAVPPLVGSCDPS